MKKALGKGLSALIPDSYVDELKQKKETRQADGIERESTQKGFELIPVSQIQPNHDQPRKVFSEEGIRDLAASIKEKGVLQPIVVSQLDNGRYELICGERRFRAAAHCGLDKIPAVIKDVAGDDFLEWAIIENIQREDLNAVEEAESYRRLADERLLSHDEIAKRVGKNRTTISNMLRLLRLPEDVRALISDDLLTTGHARALLGLMTPAHQRQMAKRIVEDNLSVRQVEAIVNRSNAHKRKPKKARNLNPEIVDLERKLTEHLGTQVKLYPRKDRSQGRLEVQYYSLDDLDRILEKIGVEKG